MEILRKKSSAIRNALMMFIAICFMTAASAAWSYDVKQIWGRFSGTAGEAITEGQLVCVKAADGLIYKADGNDAALRPAVGMAGKSSASGVAVEIVVLGRFSGWSGLSPGAYGYLSETAGDVTQSAPSYSQIVGFATSATDYYINFANYLDTSALTALGTLTGGTPLVFEGATADAYETTIAVTDPTADRTVTIPNKTGTVQLASAASVLTPGSAVTLTVGLSNIYSLALNDNEDTTITFSGAGTAGDELTIIFATGVGTTGDEVVTFHATLVSSVGTLTAANTASRFYAVKFISNGTHWYEVSRTAIQT